ncbi:MAG: squalene--hopene cyclase, partial [Methylococcales bacterium]|nr:squalene--hopene cyclase [Methylococcales bacterium]
MYTESFNEKNDLEAISVSARKAFNLDFAINAAQTELTNLQTDQGYWHFELEADCSITADYILMMHYFGEENDSLQEQMATYLRARQTENGSYSLFTGGTDDLSCSVKVYFALKLAGDKTTSLHMVKLKNYILAQGGAAKSNVFTRITLAIFEQIPWRGVPYIPVEIMLLPKWFPFH